MLFVNASPGLLVVYALAARRPVSRREVAGAALSALGGALLCLDAQAATEASLRGDSLALLARHRAFH